MTEKQPSKISQLLDSEEWQELTRLQQEYETQYDRMCDDTWNGLDQETQYKMFYSVVKRLVKGELQDNGSYRHVLYQVFGFDESSYFLGMQSGFMALHNAIYNKEDLKAYCARQAKKTDSAV
jgi:hypothetical protein